MSSTDLSQNINQKETYVLNISASTPIDHLWIPDFNARIKSDEDEQLLLHFAFNEACNLTTLRIASGGPSAPKIVKLFVNRVSLGFSDVDNVPCAQVIELKPSDYVEQISGSGVTEAVIALKTVKFTRTFNLTMFIESNLGDVETTSLAGVKFFGSLAGKTDMTALKKVGDGE
jgi:hypothetical protein